MSYAAQHHQYRSATRGEQFFSTVGRITIGILIFVIGFYAGMLYQGSREADTVTASETLTVVTAQAEKARQESVQAYSEELSAYLSGSALNSLGENVGTVRDVISRYGCGGFYRPLCAKAQAFGWRAPQ